MPYVTNLRYRLADRIDADEIRMPKFKLPKFIVWILFALMILAVLRGEGIL